MKSFVIEPLSGIRGSVYFGMSRDEVRGQLAPAIFDPFLRGTTAIDGFFGATLQVNYDAKGLVEFIEFARSENQVFFEDMDLLKTEASHVVESLKKTYLLTPLKREPSNSYRFPAIELRFWRPTTPASAQDEEGRYFESVGFGRVGYSSKTSS